MEMMKKSEASVLKGKAVKIMATAALLATLGAGAAFAVDGKNGPVTNSAPEQWVQTGSIAETESGIAVETREDGKTYYSTESGKTWSLDVPEGFAISLVDGKGNIVVSSDEETARAASEGVLGQNKLQAGTVAEAESSVDIEVREDGKTYSSTDGGKTWSLNVPEGFAVSFDDSKGTLSVTAESEAAVR